jgi:predicted RND superfamily exporter protein
MAYAGRGIVLTSVILVIGFAPLALSDYFSIWIMGTYLPMALLVALAADLYLVPALATVGLLRYR